MPRVSVAARLLPGGDAVVAAAAAFLMLRAELLMRGTWLKRVGGGEMATFWFQVRTHLIMNSKKNKRRVPHRMIQYQLHILIAGWQTHWGCSGIGVIRWWWAVLFGHWGHLHVLMITLTPVICHIQKHSPFNTCGQNQNQAFLLYMQQKGESFFTRVQFAIWTPAWGRKNQTLTKCSDRGAVGAV